MAGAKSRGVAAKRRKARPRALPGTARTIAAAGTPRSPAIGKFILTWQGIDDPDPSTVETLVKTLAPATVEAVLPGTLKVEGNSARIARAAHTLESWSLSSEGLLSAPSPARTRIDLIGR